MRILFIFICFIACSFSGFGQGFIVDDYHVDIYINKAGYFDVVEKYEVNFTERKHGLFRNIITKYKVDNGSGGVENREVLINKVDVPNQKFTKSSRLEAKSDGEMVIKIGDENKFVEGKQEYIIKYRVNNAFLFNDSTSQFYWNVKSSDWDAFFNHISFAIYLPEDIPLTKENYFLYTGATGNSTPDEDTKLTYTNGVLQGNSKPNLMLTKGTNTTVLIKMPADFIVRPSGLNRFWDQWGWLIFIPLIGFSWYYLWGKYGKDKYLLKIVHYFPPTDMDPAMAGYLINDQEDSSDLISLIPHWGAHGLLSMEEIPKKGIFGKKDTLLKKLNPLPEDASSYEIEFFNGLFPLGKDAVLISSLHNSFYTTMEKAKSLLKKEAQVYYNQKSSMISKIVAVALIIIAVLGAFLVVTYWNVFGAIAIVVFCVSLLFLNKVMKKRNQKGDEAMAEVHGFKMFVKTAEEEKLKVLLKEDANYFEKSLGFALTYGLLKQWGNKFNSLDIKAPGWYNAGTGSVFSANRFSNSFSSSMNTMRSQMVSSPSSSGGSRSGGGSSGGGFGGGGGGSW